MKIMGMRSKVTNEMMYMEENWRSGDCADTWLGGTRLF